MVLSPTPWFFYRGLFRDDQGNFIYGIHIWLKDISCFYAELIEVIHAINLTLHFGWNKLWLKTYSSFVILAFHESKLVPWTVKVRWLNTLIKIRSISFFITHIIREGNRCATNLLLWHFQPLITYFNTLFLISMLLIFIHCNKVCMLIFHFIDSWEDFGVSPSSSFKIYERFL